MQHTFERWKNNKIPIEEVCNFLAFPLIVEPNSINFLGSVPVQKIWSLKLKLKITQEVLYKVICSIMKDKLRPFIANAKMVDVSKCMLPRKHTLFQLFTKLAFILLKYNAMTNTSFCHPKSGSQKIIQSHVFYVQLNNHQTRKTFHSFM